MVYGLTMRPNQCTAANSHPPGPLDDDMKLQPELSAPRQPSVAVAELGR